VSAWPRALRAANEPIPLVVDASPSASALCPSSLTGGFVVDCLRWAPDQKGVWEPSPWRVLLLPRLACFAPRGHGRLAGPIHRISLPRERPCAATRT